MLHLAQVVKKGFLGDSGLRLLAYQKSETVWALISEEFIIPAPAAGSFCEDSLVLVELSAAHEVSNIRHAITWVLDLVQKYLTTGMSPAFLQQEAERAEQWRQSLTLESQELGRRTLELEARREQIEALEENLKQEKQQLGLIAKGADASALAALLAASLDQLEAEHPNIMTPFGWTRQN